MSSSKPKVIVCKTLGQATPILMQHKDVVDFVIWDRDEACDRAWLLENIKGAAGLMVLLGEKVDQELLDAAGPTLRVVSTVSVGYEHIDLPLTVSRGVRVGYTPNVLTEAVADVAVMLALMASRSDGQIYNLVKTGSWAQPSLVWSPFLFCGPQLSTTSTSPTRTVGFLGFGRIAQATLKRLAAFGITHCIYSGNPKSGNTISAAHAERDAALKKKLELQSIERVDLDRLALESDLVILLTPGGKDTYHAIGEDFLKKMKPMSVIVNAG
ncbi:unnamed protein product [Mycena citricolor]|uniref:D-isomer specific 2-hydroxyacid dehydrogenase catalytic domain-containing protein n=1 Tax=Mycena citricolor TaxID=2018698 RepID=A0AAD2HI02_9AGAR|nr:unnamed protein product [Mycena citricolor]